MKNKIIMILFIILIPLNIYAYEPLNLISDTAIQQFIDQTLEFNLLIIKVESDYRTKFKINDNNDTDVLIFKIIYEYTQQLQSTTFLLNQTNILFKYLNDNYLDNVQYQFAFDKYLDVLIRIKDDLKQIIAVTDNVLIVKYCNYLHLLIESRIVQCNKTISFY